MPLDLAKKVIDLFSDLNVRSTTLIGGEPTVYENLSEVISYGKKKNLRMGMITNGRKFSDKSFLQDLINSGLSSTTISIEGSNSKVHDSITKVKGSFNETIKGIKNALDSNLYFSTETTISKENRHDLINILDLLYEIGVERPGFNVCTSSVDIDSKSVLSLDEIIKTIEELYTHSKGRKIRFITPLPFCRFSKEVGSEMLKENLLKGSCQMFFGSSFVIDYNGDILPCVHWSSHSLGNIFKNGKIVAREEFLDFWNNGTPKKFREAIWKYPSEKCIEDKKYWGYCVGGCPMLWLTHDAREEIKDTPHFKEFVYNHV